MPPPLCGPWIGECAEIRCSDVPARSLDEFKRYVESYTGPSLRFLDPHFKLSAPVRLAHRGQRDIARYLLNYMGRDRRYGGTCTGGGRSVSAARRGYIIIDTIYPVPPLYRSVSAARRLMD